MFGGLKIITIFVSCLTLKIESMKKGKQIVNVTLSEMVNVLKNVKTGRMVNLVMETEPSMNKKGNPFYDKETKSFSVKKLTSKNFRLSNYQDRVRKNMEKQGLNPESFVSEKSVGKTRVEGSECLFQSDKDPNVFYFMVEMFDKVKPQYVKYFKNGVVLDEIGVQILKGFLSSPSESKKQEQDEKVKVLTPKVENILSFTDNGTKYVRV